MLVFDEHDMEALSCLSFESYVKVAHILARVLTEEDVLERGGVIETLEGPASFCPGDMLCYGIPFGEAWPMRARTLSERYDAIGPASRPGYDEYAPKKTVRLAVRLSEPFCVRLASGSTLASAAGDYLLKGTSSCWPVAADIFERTYVRLEEHEAEDMGEKGV